MREIKFRGIATVNDKHNNIKVGDFVYGCFVETNIDCQILFGDGEQISVDRKTVGQFTGLKDRNKVEIYEDDILEFESQKYWQGGIEKTRMNIGVVFFDNGYAGNPDLKFNCSSSIGNNQPSYWMCMYKKVIGNIHQNKDLIKEPNND